MKRIKKILLTFYIMPFMLSAQLLVNNGAAITIKSGSYLKIKGDYVSHQNGRIKNAGPIVLDGDWIEHSTMPVFSNGSTGHLIFTGLNDHIISGTYNPTFPYLVAGTNLIFNVSVSITGQLEFASGKSVFLNDFNVNLSDTAVFTGAGVNQYCVTNGTGSVTKLIQSNTEIIPIGSTNHFTPVSVTYNSSPEVLKFRVFDDVLESGETGNTVPFINETINTTWQIEDADNLYFLPDFDVNLQWNGSQEGTLFNRTKCAVSQFTYSSWADYPAGAASGTDPYNIEQTGITQFGYFTVKNYEPVYTGTYFVIQGGAGMQDGSSWANASPSLQNMMDIATSGQQIWVAAGTYYPETCVLPDVGDRYKSFQPNDGISIYGGFAGNEDPAIFDLSQRDFITNETILSGDVGVIGDSLDNCYHVIYLNYQQDLVIDGFTIEHGKSYYLNWWEGFHTFWGPAIYSSYSNFELKNAIVRFNTGERSGSIWADNSNVSISQSSFINNRVPNNNDGGAIKSLNSNLIIDQCSFLNNYAQQYGGCIKFSYGDLTISNSSFNGNYAGSGGVAHINASTNLLINGCDFTNNSTYLYGGALDIGSVASSGLIEDCTFTGNTASYEGGAIHFSYTTLNMNRCRFYNNNGGNVGGAISNYGTNPITLSNSVISWNTAQFGGGLYLSGSGLFRCSNTVIAQNTGFQNGGGAVTQLSALFFNTIFWDNTSPAGPQVYLAATTADPQFHYCDVEGGKESFGGTGSGANYNFDYDNAHNINTDPKFTNPAGNDFTFSGISSCINTGVPLGTAGSAFPYIEGSGSNWILYHTGGSLNLYDKDLANNPRLFDGNIDMGSYEFQTELQHIVLNLKIFLEGPFYETEMNADLNTLNLLPLSQPYNTAPWNYPGTESVAAIPGNQIVDWVLIEGRDAPNAASANQATAFARQAAFLLNDGTIVGLDGSSYIQFTHFLVESLFVAVQHRNHLSVLSASPLTETGGTYPYDFTISASQAYSDNQNNLGSSFGMIGGNGDANSAIDLIDKTSVWMIEAGLQGYLFGDFTMDGQVNNQDKNDVWGGNLGKTSVLP